MQLRKNMLKVIPLGGLGEIGLNMMSLEYEGFILVIDAGLMFPDAYMPGVDMVIPDMNGCEIMDHINTQSPDTPVIVITGHVSTESAIKALRKGAYDYIRKPFEPERLLTTVKNGLDHLRLRRENQDVSGKLALSENRYRFLVQNSPDIIYTLDDHGNFTFNH